MTALETSAPPIRRPAAAAAAGRIAPWAFRSGLVALSAAIVTNAGEVIARSHSLPVTEGLTAIVAAQVLAHQVRGRREGTGGPGNLRTAAVVLAAQVVVALASVLWAADAQAALSDVVALATDIAIVAVLIAAVRDRHDVRWVVGGLVAGAGIVAALVTVQTLTGSFDQTFGGFAQVSLAHIAGETDDIRVVGPFGDPNFFAQAMVAALPLALVVPRITRHRALRAAGVALAAAMAVTVLATFSRGALLALAVIAATTVARIRARRAVLIGVALLALALVVAPTGYAARLTAVGAVVSGDTAGAQDPSLQGRAGEMTAAVQMFVDHPAGGVGYGGYPSGYLRYSPWIGLDPRRQMREAHSLFLEVAAETGILGIGVLMIGLALARARIVRARHELRAVGATDAAALVDALALALVAFLITSVFLHGAYLRPLWLLLGLALTAPWPAAGRRASVTAAHP